MVVTSRHEHFTVGCNGTGIWIGSLDCQVIQLHHPQLSVHLTLTLYCRAAKTFGDKRADVAEKGFGRPYKKVLVSASGVLDS